MPNKVAEFRNESPHRSGKGTPKFVTPKSLCFIHQKKSQELPRQVQDSKIECLKDWQTPLIYKIKSPMVSSVDPHQNNLDCRKDLISLI